MLLKKLQPMVLPLPPFVKLPLLLFCMLKGIVVTGLSDGVVVALMIWGVVLPILVVVVVVVAVGVNVELVFDKSAFRQSSEEERDCCDRCALSLDEPLRDLGALN